jgi:hypothetical protein
LEVIVAQYPELNVTHQGREIKLAPGDATIMQASATGRVGSRESFGFFEAVISSAEWEARGARPQDSLMQRLSGKSEAMQLLRRYIGSLRRGLGFPATTARLSAGTSSTSPCSPPRPAAPLARAAQAPWWPLD